MSFSPLARQSKPYLAGPSRGRPVYGLCVHTPGRTVISNAVKFGRDPLEYVVERYRAVKEGPHYVLGYGGLRDLVQIADERTVRPHVGTLGDIPALTDGSWRRKDPNHGAQWDACWHRWHKKNPTDLFPGASPNRAYVGIEVLPRQVRGLGILDFTDAQHDAVAALFADLGARHAFRFEWGRLVGHEDVNPIRRSDAGGGWDPGALRAVPRWDWNRVMKQIGGER